ncbi:GNAT family N-acetyltransferase [Amaricoccus tamworthensis]|uniref:GNAT family N-acetyltransferase n=1 Tax=Amaricoccus tamworthensis TaxID=57002 RepID=UPI003C7DF74D
MDPAERLQDSIELKTFVLRPLTRADAGLLGLYASDRRVAEMVSSIPHPYPPGAADAYLNRVTSDDRQEQVWGIDAGQDGENGLVGVVSLKHRDADEAEIGYWVAPAVWGTGYASQSVAAVVDQARAAGLRALTANAFQENEASIKVLMRNGFKYIGESEVYSLARNSRVAAFDYRLDLQND